MEQPRVGQSVHLITVATRDLDAARRFYRDGLGWHPLSDVPGEIIFFQVAPGLVLGLFDAAKFNQDVGVPGVAELSGMNLAHNVGSPEEVHETVRVMTEAGGTVLKAPQQGQFGSIFHAQVSDPNGLVWEIAHNPRWRIAEDGTVVFG